MATSFTTAPPRSRPIKSISSLGSVRSTRRKSGSTGNRSLRAPDLGGESFGIHYKISSWAMLCSLIYYDVRCMLGYSHDKACFDYTCHSEIQPATACERMRRIQEHAHQHRGRARQADYSRVCHCTVTPCRCGVRRSVPSWQSDYICGHRERLSHCRGRADIMLEEGR